MQRVRTQTGRQNVAASSATYAAAFAQARTGSVPALAICRADRLATSPWSRLSKNSNACLRRGGLQNSPSVNPISAFGIFHRAYREFLGNIINAVYRCFLRTFTCRNNALGHSIKIREIGNRHPSVIPPPIFDSQSAHFRVISRDDNSRGVKNYASKHDGEPAPSGGPTRGRLQGSHDVDFKRAGRAHQPLRQRSPLPVSARCRDGGTRSSFHARQGKDVM